MCKYAVFKVNFQLVINRMTTRLPPSLQFKRAARKQEEMRVQRASAMSQTFKAAASFSHSDKISVRMIIQSSFVTAGKLELIKM